MILGLIRTLLGMAPPQNNNQQHQEEEEEQQVEQVEQGEQAEQGEQEGHSSNEEDWEEEEEMEEGEEEGEEEEPYEPSLDSLELAQKEKAAQPSLPGCQHYERQCKILSPCCQQWYWCRLCHDEDTSRTCKVSKLDRHSIMSMCCQQCHMEQPVSQICMNSSCGLQMSTYFCSTCVLFTNDSIRPVYHCNQCGICRIGNKDDFFHCPRCNMDYRKGMQEGHKCLAGSTDNNCFLCLEYLFDSRMAITQLDKCLHVMHVKCFNDYIKSVQGFPNCPICGQSIGKESEAFIQMVDQKNLESRDTMPQELKERNVNVLCNNCLQKSNEQPFALYGIKCQHCGSYNTKEYS